MRQDKRDVPPDDQEDGPTEAAAAFYSLYILAMFVFLVVLWVKQP